MLLINTGPGHHTRYGNTDAYTFTDRTKANMRDLRQHRTNHADSTSDRRTPISSTATSRKTTPARTLQGRARAEALLPCRPHETNNIRYATVTSTDAVRGLQTELQVVKLQADNTGMRNHTRRILARELTIGCVEGGGYADGPLAGAEREGSPGEA